MQSECIKTGAVVYLEQYGEYILTDLKQLGPVYHFWIESERHRIRTNEPQQVNLVVYEVNGSVQNRRECLAHFDSCSRFSYKGFIHA